MQTRVKILFYLKQVKQKEDKTLPIYVRVTVDKKRVEWSIKKKWEPGNRWNRHIGRAAGN